jgi:hypothetical protein
MIPSAADSATFRTSREIIKTEDLNLGLLAFKVDSSNIDT